MGSSVSQPTLEHYKKKTNVGIKNLTIVFLFPARRAYAYTIVDIRGFSAS